MVPNQDVKDVIISCTRCTVNVPIGQTTYENNTRNLICFNCYNKLAKGATPDRVVQSGELPDRTNYKCLSCGFGFSRARTFQFGGQCFNCGKKHVEALETKQVLSRDRKSLLDY